MNNLTKTTQRFSRRSAIASFTSAALFVMGALLAQPASAAAYLKYDGVRTADGSIDSNWFNPENWIGGRVPGAGDSVALDGDDRVVIDPAKSPAVGAAGSGTGKVKFDDLHISGSASLETLAGTSFENGKTVIDGGGQLIHRASGSVGDTLVIGGGGTRCTNCGLKLNPTPKSKRTVVLQSSATLDIGLGGSTPSRISKTGQGDVIFSAGRGTYATLTAEQMMTEGELKVSLYYGFRPRPGQSFQILTANQSRRGSFNALPEGGYVGCTEDNVGLRISYVGGDGNDVVLSAEATDPDTCLLLPAVQKVREAAARARF